MNELFGLAESPVYGSAVPQSYGEVPPAPFQEQRPETPSSLKYGALYQAPFPSLTTNDCFVGMRKYLLKSYEISLFGTSGFGDGVVPFLPIPSYTTTSPLLTGTRLPELSIPIPTAVPVYVGEVAVRRVSLIPDILARPLSRVSFAVAVPVPIAIFVPF